MKVKVKAKVKLHLQSDTVCMCFTSAFTTSLALNFSVLHPSRAVDQSQMKTMLWGTKDFQQSRASQASWASPWGGFRLVWGHLLAGISHHLKVPSPGLLPTQANDGMEGKVTKRSTLPSPPPHMSWHHYIWGRQQSGSHCATSATSFCRSAPILHWDPIHLMGLQPMEPPIFIQGSLNNFHSILQSNA